MRVGVFRIVIQFVKILYSRKVVIEQLVVVPFDIKVFQIATLVKSFKIGMVLILIMLE